MDRVGSGGILARLADVRGRKHHPGLGRKRLRRSDRLDRGRPQARTSAVCCRRSISSPSRNWTVAALARVMGASRSGFAERFATIVGETPARYLTQVRMHQARQWLVRDRLKIAVVARRLGYESEASFSRAFKRVIGFAPSHFRALPKARRHECQLGCDDGFRRKHRPAPIGREAIAVDHHQIDVACALGDALGDDFLAFGGHRGEQAGDDLRSGICRGTMPLADRDASISAVTSGSTVRLPSG